MTLDGIDKPTNQRPNYFAGQYLLEDDFQLEQQYHIDRQRRHNRLLHVSGIAEGLIVTKVSDLTVKITKGTAIDKQGRQIVQLEDIEALNLFKIAGDGIKQGEQIKDGNYILSVGYSCKLSDKQGEDEITSTRLLESPEFKLSSSEVKDFITLAKITINSNAVKGDINNSDRVYSGLRLPTIDGEISLSSKNDGSKSLAELKGSLNITDTLSVTGNVGIGTTNPVSKLTVVGTATISDEKHNHFATKNGFMASGSLTVGSTEKNYGGETKPWKEGTEYNAAGLLLEAKANTEIAVHDASTRLASLMYYEGDATNRITIGRNMGWEAINTVSINGNVGIGTTNPGAKLQIVDSFQNPNGATLILGSIDASNLRLGYDQGYTWIQSHGGKPLAINPLGSNIYIGCTGKELFVRGTDGNVGIGTTDPGTSKLKIANSASDFADISFSGSGMGQLQIIGWPSGWNINTMTSGKHLYLNRDTGENSDVYIGRNGKELFVRGSDGSVGIGLKDNRANYLNPASSIGTNSSLVVASKTPNLVAKLVNQTQTFDLAKTESVLTLVRDGVSGQSWSNIVDFRIGRYEKSANASRTQLDILLAHRDLEKGSPLPNPPVETTLEQIMTLRSDGYVSIGIPKNYTIEFTGSVSGNASLKVDNVSMNMQAQDLNTVILNADGTFKKQQSHGNNLGAEFLWNNWANWVNTNAGNGDIVAVVKSNFAFYPADRSGEAGALLGSIGAGRAFESHQVHYALLFIKGRIGAMELFDESNARLITSYSSLLESTRDPANPTPTPTIKLDVSGILRTQQLQLAHNFLLRSDRLPKSMDEWLSLKNPAKPGEFYGGFAAGKLFSSEKSLNASDARMKKDIRNLSKVLDKVLSLRGISFQWKDSQPETLPQLGMIAQEVEAVFPELVEMGPNNMKGINYSGFIAILIEAIKEQQEQIEKLNFKISE
ncbi:MAG: tail fiber domain-containing protein [Oscillatoriales cyanobacterium RU_3_3]|nr:tail fiber domain-containing protein [Oscillatoriales cyanobacterium RU_3_3]